MKTMSMEMSEKPCERCKAKAEEVINTEERKRVCLKCHYFEKAILSDKTTQGPAVDCERQVTLYMSFNDTSNEQGGIPDFDIQVEQLPRGQVKITVKEVQEPHWQEKRELEHRQVP